MRDYPQTEYEVYRQYVDLLSEDFGVNLEDGRQLLNSAGGIYTDTAYLLCRLASADFTSNVLEIGAGLSTLVLSKVCHRYDKKFVCLENVDEWARAASDAILGLKFPDPVVLISPEVSELPNLKENFQLVWVDGVLFDPKKDHGAGNYAGRAGACLPYLDNMRNAVVIFDDAQSPPFKSAPITLAESLGRDPSELVWFNPCGREDRHQAISLPSLDHPAYEVIKNLEEM